MILNKHGPYAFVLNVYVVSVFGWQGDICGSCETQIRAPPKPEPKTILRRLAFVLSIIAEDDLEEDGTTTLQC